jgi:hypothetical protein
MLLESKKSVTFSVLALTLYVAAPQVTSYPLVPMNYAAVGRKNTAEVQTARKLSG